MNRRSLLAMLGALPAAAFAWERGEDLGEYSIWDGWEDDEDLGDGCFPIPEGVETVDGGRYYGRIFFKGKPIVFSKYSPRA